MTQDLGETYLGHSFILTAYIRLNIVTTQDMREAHLGALLCTYCMHKAEYCYYTRYERNISRTLSTSIKETQTLPTQGNPICVKLALKSGKDSYNSGRTCIHCVGIDDLNQ